MPLTPRISTRQSVEVLNFENVYGDDQEQYAINAQSSNRVGYGDLMYGDLGFQDGGPGFNRYRMQAFTPAGYMNLYNTDIAYETTQPFTELVRGFLLVPSAMSINYNHWLMYASPVPNGYPSGDYDLGAWTSNMTISMATSVSNPRDIGFNSNIFPWLNFDSNNPAFGFLFRDGDEFCSIYAKHNDGSDNATYKAFQYNDPIIGFGEVKGVPTWSDENHHYTFCVYTDSGSSHNPLAFLSVWNPGTSTFDYTNYSIELSDSDDNDVFQNLGQYPHLCTFTCDTHRLIITFWDSPDLTSTTAQSFTFNTDMTEYKKYTFNFDNQTASNPSLFIDPIFNAKWLNVSSPGSTHFIAASPDSSGTEIVSLGSVNLYRLPCFTPCIPHAIKQL